MVGIMPLITYETIKEINAAIDAQNRDDKDDNVEIAFNHEIGVAMKITSLNPLRYVVVPPGSLVVSAPERAAPAVLAAFVPMFARGMDDTIAAALPAIRMPYIDQPVYALQDSNHKILTSILEEYEMSCDVPIIESSVGLMPMALFDVTPAVSLEITHDRLFRGFHGAELPTTQVLDLDGRNL